MRKLFFIVSLLYCFIVLLTTFLSPNQANAQGTFSCQFWGDPANFIPNTCTLVSSNCEAGYKPDDCTLWIASQEQCHGVHQCVTETPADFGCSLTDALGQCIDPTLIRCGAIYCCPEASDCNKIKEKQKNILPTPTPTPTKIGGKQCGELCTQDSDCTGECYECVNLGRGVKVCAVPGKRPQPPKTPSECPTGYTKINDRCCKLAGRVPDCTDSKPVGKYCPAGYTYDPTEDKCFGTGLDIHGKCGKTAINTALGCVPVENTSAFIKWFLGRAILIAGGIAFLMMIAGSLMVIVSSGDPNKVKAGSQLITSAIAGLVFIIFSLFLLRLIGIEILQIPGL